MPRVLIACSQESMLRDECPGCGGWLHATIPGGVSGPHGWRFCDEDCAADQQEAEARVDVFHHLHIRDLLCDCAVCSAHGLPTQAMLDEYTAYLEAIDG